MCRFLCNCASQTTFEGLNFDAHNLIALLDCSLLRFRPLWRTIMACRTAKRDYASMQSIDTPYRLSSLGLTPRTFSLPLGIGMFLANIVGGRLLDRDFRATRRDVERLKRQDIEAGNSGALSRTPETTNPRQMDPNDLLDFPIEHARLRSQPICAQPFISYRSGPTTQG